MSKIYVASSWRNEMQPAVVARLREEGHEVYDFRNPPTASGFAWSEVDPDWQSWTPEGFLAGLNHPRSIEGFASDMRGLTEADVCVQVQPCGVSAALELGWAAGHGKVTVVLLAGMRDPDLMLKMADFITTSLDEVLEFLGDRDRRLTMTSELLTYHEAGASWLCTVGFGHVCEPDHPTSTDKP